METTQEDTHISPNTLLKLAMISLVSTKEALAEVRDLDLELILCSRFLMINLDF